MIGIATRIVEGNLCYRISCLFPQIYRITVCPLNFVGAIHRFPGKGLATFVEDEGELC